MKTRRKQQPSILRTAHGTAAPALLVAERPPLDESDPPNADDTAKGLALAERRGRPFQKGNRAAENRRPALALIGVPLDAAHPGYRSALRRANAYRQRRVRELAIAHGGYLGAGPSAMLASAARALAASITLNELAAAELAAGRAKAAADLFAQAARLADSARQQELTAVALAEREHAATKANETNPWLTGAVVAAEEPNE